MSPKCIEGTTHKTLIHACACTHMSNSIQWLAPNMRSQSSWLMPSRWMPAQSANIKLSRGLVQSFSKNQGEKPQQQQPQPHGSRAKKLSRQHWLSKHRMSRKRLKQQQQLRKKLQQLLKKQQQSLTKRLIKKRRCQKHQQHPIQKLQKLLKKQQMLQPTQLSKSWFLTCCQWTHGQGPRLWYSPKLQTRNKVLTVMMKKKRKEKEEETKKEDWKDRREKATDTQNLTV